MKAVMGILLILFFILSMAFNVAPLKAEQWSKTYLNESNDWKMFHRDTQSTGYTSEKVLPPLGLKWKTNIGTCYASPAVEDGVLYIGSQRGHVYAINIENGEIIWSYLIRRLIKTTPAIDENSIYVSSWDNTVFALNKLDGSLKWRYESEYPIMEDAHGGFFIDPSPKVYKGLVYIGLADGRMHAIDAETGEYLWVFTTGTSRHSTVAIYKGIVFFGTHNKYGTPKTFYALDGETGEVIWQKELAGNIVSSSAIRDGVVFVGSGNIVYALHYEDGSVKWKYEMSDRNAIESSPAVSDSAVYICGGDWGYAPPVGALYSIDIETGKLNWKIGDNFTRVSPSIANDIIYLGNYNEYDKGIYAVNTTNGDILWSYITGYVVTSIPAIVDGKVFIAGGDGYVYGFEGSHLVIDQTFVSDNRCDVDSSQTITFHTKWSHDDSDAVEVSIYVNGTAYITNKTGWISFDVAYDSIGKRVWFVTNASYPDYEVMVSNPWIIWDQVELNLQVRKDRIDVGSEAPIDLKGVYKYDSSLFTGSVTFNDTLRKNEVGRYRYKVSLVSDPEYGLSAFISNEVYVIFDRVNIILEVADSRIEIGSNATISWTGLYKYDETPFTGFVTFNDTITKNAVGRYGYTVTSIDDPLYGLTSFTTNEVYCIFDRIKAETKVETLTPGNIQVTLNLNFEYDGLPVENAKVRVNDIAAENIGNGVYKITLTSWMPSLTLDIEVERNGFEPLTIQSISYALGNVILIGIAGLTVGIGIWTILKRQRR